MYLFPSIIVSTFTYILYPSPWNGNIIISCEQKMVYNEGLKAARETRTFVWQHYVPEAWDKISMYFQQSGMAEVIVTLQQG